MAIAEGATIESGRLVVIASNFTKPTSGQGASLGGHSVNQKSQANVNSGVTSLGAMVTVYAPALAILFGTEDF